MYPKGNLVCVRDTHRIPGRRGRIPGWRRQVLPLEEETAGGDLEQGGRIGALGLDVDLVLTQLLFGDLVRDLWTYAASCLTAQKR